MKKMKIYTADETKDMLFGKVGTPSRNKFESELREFLVGEAIKEARKKMNLTQEELGKRVGVQKAQISKIESGRNITFSTISRIFKAMGIPAKLDMGSFGKVALW